MAVQCLALFGLCLISSISAQSIDGRCSEEECTSGATDPAAGPVLLQLAQKSRRGNSTRRHSKRSSSRREAGLVHDGHGAWGGCADTNGEATFAFEGEDLDCRDYEGEFVQYCETDEDDDFRPKEMCCACGGGGPVPDPYGLGLAARKDACSGKEVGSKCKILKHVPGSNDKTHLQSQCGADHDEDGSEVLACIPAFKLRECCHIEETCKDAEGEPVADGTLCGRLFMNRLHLPSGKGHKETYRLCTCQGGQCPHCRWGSVNSEHLPDLEDS